MVQKGYWFRVRFRILPRAYLLVAGGIPVGDPECQERGLCSCGALQGEEYQLMFAQQRPEPFVPVSWTDTGEHNLLFCWSQV